MNQKEVVQLIQEAKAKGASQLDLSARGLVVLPDEIGQLPNLRLLYLMDNQLTVLPKTLGKLKDLWGLYLENNPLTALPHELGALANLQELYLSSNRLPELPPTLGRLKTLVTLRLDKNRLGSLPAELGELRNLRRLSLADNLLTSLPATIGNLGNLNSLSLARNNLGSIPDTFSQLASLEELDLSDNELTGIPPELGQLRMLRVLNLRHNPLAAPRPEVVEQGTEATLAYLRELARGKKKRYEAKLLILGDGGEGKTCVSRALRGLPFEPQRQTEGIEQQCWTFRNPNFAEDDDKSITLNIWDFQGQEIHHQTHKFFLTEKLLYLLVINGRRPFRMDRAEYWLDTIRARAPESRVILVATECEKTTPPWPLHTLKESYAELLKTDRWYFFVGCETGKGIAELSAEIRHAVAGVRVMGIDWPTSYERAEEMIRDRSTTASGSYITRRELYETFKRSEISEVGYATVARQMAALGLLTEFADSPELSDFVVLKPQWLTKGISHVMADAQLAEDKGEITHERMRSIWDTRGYYGLYPAFHHCMKEFELCYDMEHSDGCLVPLWFGEEKLPIPWTDIPGAKERRVEYKLNKRPPRGVMSLFIVKTHHMIAKTPDMPKGVYWQNGVFLRTGSAEYTSEALCELNAPERTLSIRVRAAFPQNMIEQLHGFARAVFEFFEGLKPERSYGCVKFEAGEEQCPAVHPERQILFALSHEPHEIPCGLGWHKVDPRRLVYGLSTFGEVAFTVKELRQELARKPPWAQGVIKDLNDCLLQVDETYAQVQAVLQGQSALSAEMRQQVELGMREYLRLLSDMLDNRDFSAVPGIVSIVPADQSVFDPRTWFEKEYKLTPYCEWEDGIHPDYYSVSFLKSRAWWEKTAPKLALGVRVLAAGMQMAFAGTPLAVSDPAYAAIRKEVEFMKELTKHLGLTGGATSDVSEEAERIVRGGPWSAGRHDLRDHGTEDTKRRARFQLVRLFKDIAPANYGAREWGSLRRIRMSDNTYRWLCPKHTRAYTR